MSFDELRAFIEVARWGSFTAAARSLRASRTTLRRQVEALEARAGTSLLIRTSDGVVPTESGRRLLEKGARIERDFSALLASVRDVAKEPAGELHVALPLGIQPVSVSILLRMFRGKWPELSVRMRFHETPIEADLPGVELVVSLGGSPAPESWVSRPIARIPRHLVASRAYLEERGVPQGVGDLARHDLLSWTAPGESGKQWPTRDGWLQVSPMSVGSDLHLFHVLAHEGVGIAFVADAGFMPMPGYEPLVPVLPGIVGDQIELRAATPKGIAELPRVRVLIDSAIELLAAAGADVAPPG